MDRKENGRRRLALLVVALSVALALGLTAIFQDDGAPAPGTLPPPTHRMHLG